MAAPLNIKGKGFDFSEQSVRVFDTCAVKATGLWYLNDDLFFFDRTRHDPVGEMEKTIAAAGRQNVTSVVIGSRIAVALIVIGRLRPEMLATAIVGSNSLIFDLYLDNQLTSVQVVEEAVMQMLRERHGNRNVFCLTPSGDII